MTDFIKDVMPLKNKFYRLALRMVHDDAEAQDITQEVLIRLWTRSGQLTTVADAEKLGLTITVNLSKDALKRAGRDHEQIDGLEEHFVLDAGQSAADSLVARERHEIIRRLIAKLPLKQRTVIQLRDIEGMSYKAIAEAVETTEEQVKINLFRARQALKQHVKKINNGL